MKNVCESGYRRVQKSTAKKMFMHGDDVFVVANNMRISSPWTIPAVIVTENEAPRTEKAFEQFVNAFALYNCPTKKTWPVFLIKEK